MTQKFENAKDFWNIKGDFGMLDAPLQQAGDTFSAQNDFVLVKTGEICYTDCAK